MPLIMNDGFTVNNVTHWGGEDFSFRDDSRQQGRKHRKYGDATNFLWFFNHSTLRCFLIVVILVKSPSSVDWGHRVVI